MLIEVIAGLLLASSCDVTRAALGACGSGCAGATSAPGSFTLCETTSVTKPGSGSGAGTTSPKPQRLCSYYANNSIDAPTLTVIQAWVEVGSRLCIGDAVPEKVPVYKSVSEQLQDIFKGQISNPRAWLLGPTDPEPFEEISFEVESQPISVSGELSGRAAKIRFRPVSFKWSFSDGNNGSGPIARHFYESEGPMTARALVAYEVDYLLGGTWTISAARWSLGSNEVGVLVIDPPRRTLLIP